MFTMDAKSGDLNITFLNFCTADGKQVFAESVTLALALLPYEF